MTSVTGKVTAGELNVRSQPTANSRASAAKLKKDTMFTGELVTAQNNEVWVKLSTVNNLPISFEGYIASWYTEFKEVPEDEEADDEPSDGFVGIDVIVNTRTKVLTLNAGISSAWKVFVDGNEYTIKS